MTRCLGLLFLWLLTRGGSMAQQKTTALPSGVLPDGFGVNIHFTDPKPGEIKLLAAAGFRWIRMDFFWHATEKQRGRYDFHEYDRLLAALDPYKIRALFILDYSNPIYDDNQSPATPEGRKAFAKWAAAAAKHFQNRGVLWEMYNEPNVHFWRPTPNVNAYVALALEVGKALRGTVPDAVYVGPATSKLDMPFLEACFKAGLLDYWSAVTVHPYRSENPETAASELRLLRLMIRRYAPEGKKIPIFVGEWGYSTTYPGVDEGKQGKYLARQWLFNVANDIPLSIWYDWHDDGTDAGEVEHHFGTVRHAERTGQEPLYEPKPAYLAARTLTEQLKGFRFQRRIQTGTANDPNAPDYILLFRRGKDVKIVAWTSRPEPTSVALPVSPGTFRAVAHTGEKLPELTAGDRFLSLHLTDAPQYITPNQPNASLLTQAQIAPPSSTHSTARRVSEKSP